MNGAQRTIPNSVTGECRGPLRSNPAIPTRGVSNPNQFRTKYKQVAKFTSPGGICLWHHWWAQPGSPTLKVSQHRSEKGSSTVKGKILSWKQGHSSQRWQAPNRTLAFPFSLHLPPSPRCSVSAPRNQHQSLSALRAHVQSITQSTWLHFLIYPSSHHLTISTAGTLD